MNHPHMKAIADILTRQTSTRDFDRFFSAIVMIDRLVKEQDARLDDILTDPIIEQAACQCEVRACNHIGTVSTDDGMIVCSEHYAQHNHPAGYVYLQPSPTGGR